MLLKKKGKKQRGSMITEVLVTTLLIIIAMLAVIPMLAIGVKSGSVSKGRTLEMHIAKEKVEAFNSENFSNVYTYLETTILSSDPVPDEAEKKWTRFKLGKYINPNTGVTEYPVHKYTEDIYINPANGKKVRAEDTSDGLSLLKNGYKKFNVEINYSYLGGDTASDTLDDSIQISLKVRPTGEGGSGGKPVQMTAVLSRDKF